MKRLRSFLPMSFGETSSSAHPDSTPQNLLFDKYTINLNCDKMIDELRIVMSTAETFEEWKRAAVKLDLLENREIWKMKAECAFYDHQLVQLHAQLLSKACIDQNLPELMRNLRHSLHRNFAGFENLHLYEHTHVGTKYLIENYVKQAVLAVNTVSCAEDSVMDSAEKLSFFKEVRRLYGTSALLLSGGACFGLYHLGVIKALSEAGLLPQVIAGSSAGSIVAAIVCVNTDDELRGMFKPGALRLDLFDGEDSLIAKMRRFASEGVMLDITYLQNSCRKAIGDITFLEAYERTGRALCVTVSVLKGDQQQTRILNYMQTPHVVIWSAACASCAVPGIFSPVVLKRKSVDGKIDDYDPTPQRYLDGSYLNDLPMEQLSDMFGVNFFIVSQVNPYVIPFMKGLRKRPSSECTQGASAISRVSLLIQEFAKSELQHRFVQLAELGFAPRMLEFLVPVINQSYSGDVTIVPELRNCFKQYSTILSNPTEVTLQEYIGSGQRSTWPALSMISNHCQIEIAIRNAVLFLKRKVAKTQKMRHVSSTMFLELKDFKSLQHLHDTKLMDKDTIFSLTSSSSSSSSMPMHLIAIIVSARCRVGLLADIAFTMAKLGLRVIDAKMSTCGQWAFNYFHVRVPVPTALINVMFNQMKQRLETLLLDEQANVQVKLVQEIPSQYTSSSSSSSSPIIGEGATRKFHEQQRFAPPCSCFDDKIRRRVQSTGDLHLLATPGCGGGATSSSSSSSSSSSYSLHAKRHCL